MTDTILPPVAPSVTPLTISVEVRERPISNRASVLDITYDGSQPPDELFADLRALGWRDAVATTPRADVIEWGVPDPARNRAYVWGGGYSQPSNDLWEFNGAVRSGPSLTQIPVPVTLDPGQTSGGAAESRDE